MLINRKEANRTAVCENGNRVSHAPHGYVAILSLKCLFFLFLAPSCSEDDMLAFALDTAPPRVVAAFPPDGMKQMAPDGKVWFLFDRGMDRPQTERAFSLTGPEGEIHGAFEWKGDRRVEFTPSRRLNSGGQYMVRLASSAESGSGKDLKEEYRAHFSLSADTSGPTLLRSRPKHRAQGVAPDSSIELDFSEPVSFSSLENGISVSPSFAYVLSLKDDGSTVVINPNSALSRGLNYDISLTQSIRDRQGNDLIDPETVSFRVGQDSNPEIQSVSADDVQLTAGQLTHGISKDCDLVIQFSEPMEAPSVEAEVDLSPDVAILKSWNSNTDRLTLDPESPLSSETDYELTLPASLTDHSGNEIVNPGKYPFVTNASDSQHPEVVLIQQGLADPPGIVDGAEITRNYRPDPELPDYGIVDTSHVIDVDRDEAGIDQALVFRILFNRDMELASLHEGIEFIPVLNTGSSEIAVHSIQFGTDSNEVLVIASWTPTGSSESPVYALQISTKAKDSRGNPLQDRFRRYLAF